MHSADANGRAIISFHTQPGPSLIRGGVEVDSTRIARLGRDHSYFQRSSGSVHWGSMSLPVEDICAAGAAMTGCDLTPLSHELIVSPLPAALARLQRLHAEAGDLAESAPGTLANADASRGLEQALIEAMVACLKYARARGQLDWHAVVMKKLCGGSTQRSQDVRGKRSILRICAPCSGSRSGRSGYAVTRA